MDRRNSQEVRAPRPSAMTGTRRTQMRIMQRKSVGVVAVYEQDPVASEAGSRTLVFESPTVKVCVKNFPVEWQKLSDDQLAELRRAAS